jgi:hypothetical protein
MFPNIGTPEVLIGIVVVLLAVIGYKVMRHRQSP